MIQGFVSAVTQMRSYVPAIYDCTVAVPSNQKPPTLLRLLRGQPAIVKLQIKRHSMQELPETPDGIAQWCKDLFVTKDAFLETYHGKDLFGTEQRQDIGRPIKSLLVVSFWSCLLVYGVVEFFLWSALLTSWEGVMIVVAALVLVTLAMHILIQSSESERSTPVEDFQQGSERERLLQK